MASRQGPQRRWLGGSRRFDWDAGERAYATLLDALTRDRLEMQAVEREMSSSARTNLADVQENQEKIQKDELADARRELSEFRAALADVRARSGDDGQREVAYDSRDAKQDSLADVLIQYVVRPGYAEVRTEEPQPDQYVYYIRVDWPRLRALAEEQGQPLSI